MERMDRFEITVNGCTVTFQKFTGTLRMEETDHIIESTKDIEIIVSACMPGDGGDKFISVIERTGKACIGSPELNEMLSFEEFKDHLQRTVPEEARRRGVEPFQISDIRVSEYEWNDEVVTLSSIAGGGWEAFNIELIRTAPEYADNTFLSVNQELRRHLSTLTEN
jgi:hypothetical protein